MFDPAKIQHVYIACGYTDLRRGIDGLVNLVQNSFHLDPFANALFLFCGRRVDRFKALYWDSDGFILLYTAPLQTRKGARGAPQRCPILPCGKALLV